MNKWVALIQQTDGDVLEIKGFNDMTSNDGFFTFNWNREVEPDNRFNYNMETYKTFYLSHSKVEEMEVKEFEE